MRLLNRRSVLDSEVGGGGRRIRRDGTGRDGRIEKEEFQKISSQPLRGLILVLENLHPKPPICIQLMMVFASQTQQKIKK